MNNTLKNETIYILKNAIIMDFLANEAREQVAADIRAKTGSGTTAKAVLVLLMRGKDRTIIERYETYLAMGIAAAAKLRAAA